MGWCRGRNMQDHYTARVSYPVVRSRRNVASRVEAGAEDRANDRDMTSDHHSWGVMLVLLAPGTLGGMELVRIVSLTGVEQNEPAPDERSLGRERIPPLVRRLFTEDPQRRARDEMALQVEGVVDGGVHAEKPLGGAS